MKNNLALIGGNIKVSLFALLYVVAITFSGLVIKGNLSIHLDKILN